MDQATDSALETALRQLEDALAILDDLGHTVAAAHLDHVIHLLRPIDRAH